MHTVLNRARAWMYRHARPLDLMRFRYHFEDGSREDVLTALFAYQNPDSGFAHALEADSWSPHSSPLQTWCAVELLHEIGMTDSSHPIVQSILTYLTSGASFDGEQWHTVLQSNNNHPHAPWWSTEQDCHWNDNPTACLAGFLLLHCQKDSDGYALGLRCAKASATRLINGDKQHDMHALRCYIRLYQYAKSAGCLHDLPDIKDALRIRISEMITKNPQEWQTTYCCRPSQLIDQNSNPFAADHSELIAAECSFILRTQLESGAWEVPWSWGAYPAEWAVSRMWWQGDIIIRNLLFLREFTGHP